MATGGPSPRGWTRRSALAALGVLASNVACGTQEWQNRLRGNALVLLGEVHDNARLHGLRLQALRGAIAAGWRPAIAMEQFDRERQPDIDRARRERPDDAQHLIDQAGTLPGGWNWAFYRPVIALALEHGLPLLAANLSGTETRRLVSGGYAAVFSADQQAALGLDRPPAADWQAAQEREIDVGHCGALPKSLWPAMARAQLARDAVMAAVIQADAAEGVVLLAGNGHVRRDIGVPRWLGRNPAQRSLVVGFLEAPVEAVDAAFDIVVGAPPATREDPCRGLVKPGAVK